MVSNDDINNFTFKEYLVSDDPLFSNPEDKLSVEFPTVYTMVKRSVSKLFKPDPAILRISYDVKVWYTTGNSNIFKNGVAVGIPRATAADATYHTYVEDVGNIGYGDVVDIRCEGCSSRFNVRNFLVKGFLIEPYIDLFDIVE